MSSHNMSGTQTPESGGGGVALSCCCFGFLAVGGGPSLVQADIKNDLHLLILHLVGQEEAGAGVYFCILNNSTPAAPQEPPCLHPCYLSVDPAGIRFIKRARLLSPKNLPSVSTPEGAHKRFGGVNMSERVPAQKPG